jgi:hypothetical protein
VRRDIVGRGTPRSRQREILWGGTPPPSLPRRYAPGEEPGAEVAGSALLPRAERGGGREGGGLHRRSPASDGRLPATTRLLHGAALVALATALLFHLGDLHWTRFLVAFALIDLGGYLPGAVAFRRARGAPIPALYHRLYNVTHSFLTAGVAVLVWSALAGPEWAMLAIPLHLCGDRALFGNGPKPAHLPFEHVAEVRS